MTWQLEYVHSATLTPHLQSGQAQTWSFLHSLQGADLSLECHATREPQPTGALQISGDTTSQIGSSNNLASGIKSNDPFHV